MSDFLNFPNMSWGRSVFQYRSHLCVTRVRRRRRDEFLDAAGIEHEKGDHSAHLDIVDQCQPAIVENEPATVESNGDDRMIFVDNEIANDDKLHVFSGDARFRQSEVFRDGVILTIAEAAGERCEWCGPAILHAPLREVAHRADGKIDRAINHPDAGTTRIPSAFRYNRKELFCCRGALRYAFAAAC